MAANSAAPDRILLILDLDETLVHACEHPLDRPADFRLFDYHVYRRPGLDEFLAACTASFDLAVWSSASDDYVAGVVEAVFPNADHLSFVWGRSRATWRRHLNPDDVYLHSPHDHRHYLKPLRKLRRLRWRLERMLIVDDTPEKCVRNYGNAIYVRPYEGDPEDNELSLLAAYLQSLKDCPNVRTVEKRRWRDEALRLSSTA